MTDESMRANPWQRLTRRVAYENPWITIFHDEVRRPDGQPGIYGVVHFAGPALGVVAFDDLDRVLLVGQYRYTLEAYSWEIPEGAGLPGETSLEGAMRELREETGYVAAGWREIARSALSNSVTDETATLFVATDLTAGAADPEGTEALAVRWVPFDQVLAMCLDGRILDAMTQIAVQRLALERR